MQTAKFLRGRFLKAADMKGKEPLPVTISSVEEMEVGQPKESKLVIFFKELEQGLVAGAGIQRLLGELFDPHYDAETGSSDTDTWLGQEMVLYYDPNVLFQGKRVGGVRLRKE